MKSQERYPILFSFIILFLFLQMLSWNGIRWPILSHKDDKNSITVAQGTRDVKPNLGVVPPIESIMTAKMFSFGDDQFYFRRAAQIIQQSGDTFGRVTPLKDYDYKTLSYWWSLLDHFDSKSNYVPTMVAYYFGASQNAKAHAPYVIEYLEKHADHDPDKKWWWYTQAVYHANFRLEDRGWAMKIAQKLRDIPESVDMPIWTRQMKAFILEDEGEYKQACEIILNILDNHEKLSEGEINFMMHFINTRVAAMVEADKNADYSKIDPRCTPLVELKKEEIMKQRSKNNI